MAEAARARGWKWFFSGDHSPSLKVASGLPVPALRKKMENIKKLNESLKGFRVLCGSEVDILGDGKMDYPDEILAELDCVVASVHTRFNQSQGEMTERILKALRNPHVDILGHISGRLINKRESYAVDYEAVLQTAKESQTAVEINGQPQRQELNDTHIKRAVELGVPLALTTDAHSTQDLNNMILAVHIARRGWAEPRHIINRMPIEPLLDWLKPA
jgi:DNA polymerase (family 10)